jgi:putative thiamine transport system permease protein
MRAVLGRLPVILLWAAPSGLGLVAAVAGAADHSAWESLFAHPQLWPALAVSMSTGMIATLLALAAALVIAAGCYATSLWARIETFSAFGLAIPHLAFAVGFGFLVMPSGLIARLAVGGDTPPSWITVQDPCGITLTLALALKEIPFLLAMIWSVLSRGDMAAALAGQCRAAQSLGHGGGSVWLRVVVPQLLGQLGWPLAAVFAYGATVVDMAVVLGPAQPPPLAVVVWHDLNDAELATQARGLAGAMFLTLAIALAMTLARVAGLLVHKASRSRLTCGPSLLGRPRYGMAIIAGASLAITGAAVFIIAVLSISARWPYPDLLPSGLSLAAWGPVITDGTALVASLAIALACAIAGLALVISWYETQPPSSDRWLLALAAMVLVVPQLVSAAGQYRLFLTVGLTGTPTGLFLAHLTPAFAYAVIVTQAPYRCFDSRYAAAARALGSGRLRTLLAIKLPLLKAPLLAAAAVCFAISMAQFVPAQLMAGGRYATLPMEAVTLASGGNRPLLAAFALALALPPLAAFMLAMRAGRPRWR